MDMLDYRSTLRRLRRQVPWKLERTYVVTTKLSTVVVSDAPDEILTTEAELEGRFALE
jgi:hypothetical protein